MKTAGDVAKFSLQLHADFSKGKCEHLVSQSGLSKKKYILEKAKVKFQSELFNWLLQSEI